MCAHLDSTALWSSEDTSTSYSKWCNLTGQSQLLVHSKQLIDEAASVKHKRKLNTSKLSFLSEASGKTRVIAIADYWTQVSLLSLHVWAMQSLKQLNETDCTYNHERGVTLLKEDSRLGCKDIFSLDLSSATDRFPVSLQEDLLAEVLGQEKASA